LLPNPPEAHAHAEAISGDGSTVGGRAGFPGATGYHGYRSSQPGVLEDLGTISELFDNSSIKSFSNDASVAVGIAAPDSEFLLATRAIRWTAATGMVDLGNTRPGFVYNTATGVSRDGSVVVGTSSNGPQSDAFMWTEAAGMQILPPLPGSPDGYTFARKANFDGSIIVGESGQGTRVTLCMWRNGQPVNLGIPSNANGEAVDVNDDGTVVIGGLQTPTVSGAAIWTPSRGTEFLSTYLTDFGVTIPTGWSLTAVHAVSGDGMTFAGYANNTSTGQHQGFIATVPSPASFVPLFLVVSLGALRRSRNDLHDRK
jgi:probable HAF family extracellular repeat protein